MINARTPWINDAQALSDVSRMWDDNIVDKSNNTLRYPLSRLHLKKSGPSWVVFIWYYNAPPIG